MSDQPGERFRSQCSLCGGQSQFEKGQRLLSVGVGTGQNRICIGAIRRLCEGGVGQRALPGAVGCFERLPDQFLRSLESRACSRFSSRAPVPGLPARVSLPGGGFAPRADGLLTRWGRSTRGFTPLGHAEFLSSLERVHFRYELADNSWSRIVCRRGLDFLGRHAFRVTPVEMPGQVSNIQCYDFSARLEAAAMAAAGNLCGSGAMRDCARARRG